jgi:hypothetical protein
MMRDVRFTVGRMLAAALLTLCVGLQVLEATGRWDRTIQDTGDEAVIVTVILCVGAALGVAAAVRQRLRMAPTFAILVRVVNAISPRPSPHAPAFATACVGPPPLSLRI